MTDGTAGTDDVLVVRSVAPALGRYWMVFYVVQTLLAVLQVATRPNPFRWALLLFWLALLAAAAVFRRRTAEHPAEVTLGATTVDVRSPLGRHRTFETDDIQRLFVDPAGGPRWLTLFTRDGRVHRLAVVPDEQVADVKAWWSRHATA